MSEPPRFICALCEGAFTAAWSDAEAAAEARRDFGVDDPASAGMVLVCDDCYLEIRRAAHGGRQELEEGDVMIPREQWDRERLADGTFRVRCSLCGKSVSSPLAEPVIVRAWVECPECIETVGTVAALGEAYAALETLANDYEAILGDGLTGDNEPGVLRDAREVLSGRAKADGKAKT